MKIKLYLIFLIRLTDDILEKQRCLELFLKNNKSSTNLSHSIQRLAVIKIRCAEHDKPTIQTPQGVVQGHYIKSYGGRTVSAFEGIPYAKPPVGEFRFKEPEPAEPWTEPLVVNTTYVCLQFTPAAMTSAIMGTEDCLYLYVYVPRELVTGNENLSVVAHIHGGAFMLGAPKFLAGPNYIIDKDVIYVSFNYRLGIMGFLSTEDNVVPGNNGLKDQVLALKWIQSNIRYFGGNPNSVTLTGLSAGAASVHYHYLSPLSKGLFHRGVSISGTVLNMWALTENPMEKTRKVATFLNCTTQTTKEMIDCIKDRDERSVVQTLKKFFVFINAIPFTPFGPVIENGNGAFLPDHPYKLLSEGKVNDCPWIASNTKDEGIYPVGFFVLYGKLGDLDKNWESIIPAALDYNETASEEDKIDITRKLRERYLNNETLTLSNLDKQIQLFTDRLFLYDGETAIRLHARASKSPVYYYFYEYKMQMRVLFSLPVLRGSAHSDDGRILFTIIGNPEKLPEEDENMKDILTEFIYSFANDGTPKMNSVEWNRVGESNDIKLMRVVSPKNIYMDSVEELSPRDFWNHLNIIENEKLFKQL